MCKVVFKKTQGKILCGYCKQPFHLKCVGTQYEDTQACVSCHSGGLNSSDTSECGLQLGDNAYPGISELKDITNQCGSSFLQLNVRSLLSKIAEIKLILNKYEGIQMLAVTETHLCTQIHDSEHLL